MLVLGACSAAATVPSTSDASLPLVVTNQGGSLEGHTPRGFAGTGTGLFAGDNLSPGFPEGAGVQFFLTFELPGSVPAASSVLLASDALVVQGSPFDDLGSLSAEVVAYESFGPQLFDAPALSDATPCIRTGDARLECDLSATVGPLLMEGVATVQVRLKFAQPADNDGKPDLAMFFRSDSNTNEPALFTLTITP